jgi:diguanylate cyclase (GGDEF)-like protein
MSSSQGDDGSAFAACDSEPICIPGSIQPHGALLALEAARLTIAHASANSAHLLGFAPADLFGASPAVLLGSAQFEPLAAALRSPAFETGFRNVLIGSAAEPMECTYSRFGDSLLVELQPAQNSRALDALDISLSLQAPLARMDRTTTIDEHVRVAAAEIRSICGFDRVMIYRFDEDWHGEVLAEDVSERVPVAYLGLHFPAADIPVQARALYVLNTLRLIPDIAYAPVPIVSATRDAAALDLSRSELRSVSPNHVEYLHNIGVSATLTISIIVRGKLWGLVACHHRSPRRINHAVRSTCNFFAQMLALKLTARLEVAALARRLTSTEALARFVAGLESTRTLCETLQRSWIELMPIFGADALLVSGPEGTTIFGSPLEASELEPVLETLRATAQDGIAHSASLATLDADARRWCTEASGALSIDLSATDGYRLVILRREQRARVTWAGDPNSAIATPGKRYLSPRTSFEAWEEITQGQSTRWTRDDIENARSLRDQLAHWLRARDEVRLLAHYDPLTELPNRRLLDELLRRSLDDADAHAKRVGLLFIDVDRFKRFNDRLGHAAGDRVLRHVAARISRAVRDTDIVGRMGGDEFVVIMPSLTDRAVAERVAERLLGDAAQALPGIDGHDLRVSLSIGISVYPDDGTSGEELLSRADAAMYYVKGHGRGAWQSHSSTQTHGDDTPARRAELIARALDRDEIVPYFQPIVHLATGRIAALEALARWNHPVSGVLGPAAFIAIAEESDLIVRLGATMLDAACRHVSAWRDAHASDLRIAVNVSPRQLRDFRFASVVYDTLARHRLPADALELEITEGMMVGDASQSIGALRELAAAGVRIAIDDFGTGYSSFNYLRKLPVRSLKIDQSFIAELSDPESQQSGAAIIRAIVAVAKSLRLEVIGEGIETAAQLRLLRSLECDFVQGYHLGRPIPAADVPAALSASKTRVEDRAPTTSP